MKKFDKAKVGDKVWSPLYGYGIIDEITSTNYPIYVKFDGFGAKSFDKEGYCYNASSVIPTLYFNQSALLVCSDPEPKRMIKKSVTKYFNLYKNGGEIFSSTSYGSKDSAKKAWESLNPFTKVLVKEQEVTFEYEEEE